MTLLDDREKEYAVKYGNRVKVQRQRLKLTVDQLAAKIGVSRQTVWRWEKGASLPNIYRVGLLREALGIWGRAR